MAWHLPSYGKKKCCSADCHNGYSPERPCWGDVEARDEVSYGDGEWGWVHACEGHSLTCTGDGGYVPSDRPEDQGVSPVEDDR